MTPLAYLRLCVEQKLPTVTITGKAAAELLAGVDRLAQLAHHPTNCPAMEQGSGEDPCDCGLDEALAALEGVAVPTSAQDDEGGG